jgi:hypothetical protein
MNYIFIYICCHLLVLVFAAYYMFPRILFVTWYNIPTLNISRYIMLEVNIIGQYYILQLSQ